MNIMNCTCDASSDCPVHNGCFAMIGGKPYVVIFPDLEDLPECKCEKGKVCDACKPRDDTFTPDPPEDTIPYKLVYRWLIRDRDTAFIAYGEDRNIAIQLWASYWGHCKPYVSITPCGSWDRNLNEIDDPTFTPTLFEGRKAPHA